MFILHKDYCTAEETLANEPTVNGELIWETKREAMNSFGSSGPKYNAGHAPRGTYIRLCGGIEVVASEILPWKLKAQPTWFLTEGALSYQNW